MTGTHTQQEIEIELLKTAFKGNESLLQLVRSIFFGMELSEVEKKIIKTAFANPQLREAIRKRTYPILSKDTPVGTEDYFWSGIESQIFGRDKDTIYQIVKAKSETLKMFQRAFALLDDPFGEPLVFDYDPTLVINDPLQIGLLARNLYYKAMSVALATIKVIVEQKENETPQETAKRLNKDSSK